ncbi:hypothetical protein ACHAXS_009614 [Conticribra weissflogii]
MIDEKSGETSQASVSKQGYSGIGGRGRGRGGRGGRGGRSQGSERESRAGNPHIKPSIGRGRGTGCSGNANHSRHPRQPSNSAAKSKLDSLNQKESFDQRLGNKGGAGKKGRPRSSSDDRQEYYATKKLIEGPYSHLFCSERHGFALSRVLFQNQDWRHILLQTSPLQMKQHREKSTRAGSLPTCNLDIKKITSDQLEQWWEAVKIVRCQVSFYENMEATSNNQSFAERCPICLDDEMVCPFIAPCGHSFCLPCVLGYLHAVAKDLNAENDRIKKNKQTSSSGVVGSSPVGMATNRASVTNVRARCPLCSSGSSLVLNAGESLITYKDLRPVVFVPVVAVNAKKIDESRCSKVWRNANNENNSREIAAENAKIETRMKFVKLHRVRGCPAPYLPLCGNRIRGGVLFSNDVTNSPELCLPDLPDGDDDVEECIYARQYFTGTKEYERVLQYDLDELMNYREKNIHCRLDPREDWNVSMAIEAILAAQRRWNGNYADDGFRVMELAAKTEQARGLFDFVLETCSKENRTEAAQIDSNNAKEGNAIGDENIASLEESKQCNESREVSTRHHGRQKLKNSALLNPGSTYLHHSHIVNQSSEGIQESITELMHKPVDEFLFYQSSDGQLCFLSGIDVALLINEFSLYNCDEGSEDIRAEIVTGIDEKSVSPIVARGTTSTNNRNRLPLPDELTGSVIAIEHVGVTPSLIKRKPFLSHVPMNSTVSFVEIDWYSGGDDGKKPMLSQRTLSKFREELQRRKSVRIQAAKVERKADMAAKAKSLKDERRLREDLLGSGFVEGGGRQIIDPNDEFFQIQSNSANLANEPTYKFNQVCAEGGFWPELASAAGIGHDVSAGDNSIMPRSPTSVSVSHSKIPATNSPWGTRKVVGTINPSKSLSNGKNSTSPGADVLRNLSEASLSSQRKVFFNSFSTKSNNTHAPPPRPKTDKSKMQLQD